MNRNLYAVVCLSLALGLIVVLSGCSSSSGSSCNPSYRPFQNVRSSIRSCFQGDPCNTCNPPAGQPANCGTNVAPLCESCGTGAQPVFPGTVDQGVPYYGETNLNSPVATPGPVYNETGASFQNGLPSLPSSDIYGTGASNGAVVPPNF